VGAGAEPTLRTRLADALALASLAGLPVPVRVAIAGPGLDGELSAAYVRSRCRDLGGELAGRLGGADVEPYLPALARHPSESTALLAAGAVGIVGRAEIRDNADLVSLTGASTDIYMLNGAAVIAGNRLAQQLRASRSLAEAEATTRAVCGRSELDHERQKAETLRLRAPPSMSEMRRTLERYWAYAARSGITLATFRRLSEVMRLTRYDPVLIRSLAGARADPRVAICRTAFA
jgi:hypothetical protein